MTSDAGSLDSSYILVGEAREPTRHNESTAGPSTLSRSTGNIGLVESYAHNWNNNCTGGIRISGKYFLDKHNRVCHLRGVNVSGACKTPSNDDHAIFPDRHEDVTFVNRPFPLEEAPEHFARLRRWGLTFIRFLVTWEAIEHTGPGEYDYEFLEYFKSLLSLLPRFGLTAFVVMHQDVWSRYTGGSGAPAWTVASVGFDLHKLEDAGAAWLRGVRGGGHVEEERGIWPCGYQKLAAATAATCFWAGDTFTPKVKIGEESIQQYLQGRYLAAWKLLAETVGSLEGVIGFEMMNEPHRGYIELPSMHTFDYNTDLHLSYVPSALQSFALGSGHCLSVPHYTRSFPMPTKLTSYEVVNKEEINVWRTDGPTSGSCIWEMHGVWGWDKKKNQAVSLRENYFVKNPMTDKKVDWYTDFYYPFTLKWASLIRQVIPPEKMILLEPIPNEYCPASWTPDQRPPNFVYAPHWYDLNALFNKAFGDFSVNVQGLSRGMFVPRALYWGQAGVRENYKLQISNIVAEGYKSLGNTPVIIGECGIPMDMNRGEAFRNGNFTFQARMMDAMITALESSFVGFTLWNYNPDNDDARGDYWNGENFSWFSRARAHRALSGASLAQKNEDLDKGGRILRSVVRPYPAKTAGTPIKFEYEVNTGRFVYEWEDAPPKAVGDDQENLTLTSRETEFFVPAMLAKGRTVAVHGLRARDEFDFDEHRQTLTVRLADGSINGDGIHRVEVIFEPPLEELFPLNTFWTDFKLRILAFTVAILAVIFMYVF